MNSHCVAIGIVALVSCLVAPAIAATPSVDMEIVTEPGVPLEAPRQWIETLKDLGFSNLRVRSGQRGDVGQIKKGGTDARPQYSVTGIVTSANVLKLPGGTFQLTDKNGIRNWVAKLGDGGEEGVIAKKVMYGLTAKQMLEVHAAAKVKVNFSTKSKKTSDILAQLANLSSLEIAVSKKAGGLATSDEPCADELQGLSLGTVLAAVIRPHGCVFVPEKRLGADLRLLVTDSANIEKSWPIGWESPTPDGKLVPDYFKVTNAEITDFTLAESLDAIQKRIKLPMVFDYNSMAREKVEPGEIKVSTKKGKKSYAVILDEILYQGKLKVDVRIDEAETPFLWITTIREQ